MNKQTEITTLSVIDSLKAELDIVELEERLEMVSVMAVAVANPGGNGMCCCS